MHLYDVVRPRPSGRLPLYQQTCRRASRYADPTFFGLSQRLVITRTRERNCWARDSFFSPLDRLRAPCPQTSLCRLARQRWSEGEHACHSTSCCTSDLSDYSSTVGAGGREFRNISRVCSSGSLCSDLAFSSSDRDYRFRSNQQEPDVRKGAL